MLGRLPKKDVNYKVQQAKTYYRPHFPVPLDLKRCLDFPLQAGGFKTSVFGSILQSMKLGANYLEVSDTFKEKVFDGLLTRNNAMGNVRWDNGPSKVASLEKREMEAKTSSDFNQIRLDALTLLLDNKYIELETEAERDLAVELGIIKIPDLVL